MHIKLTEIIRATTLTLNIKDAPVTALPIIKDAFAKLAADLEELADAEDTGPSGMTYAEAQRVRNAARSRMVAQFERISEPLGSAWNLLKETVGDVIPQVEADPVSATVNLATEVFVAEPAAEKPRRGRPPKMKVEEPASAVELTPMEQALAAAYATATQSVNVVEDEQSQGETSAPAAESSEAPPSGAATASNTELSPTSAAQESESPMTPATSVSDSDLQKYCVKLAQHYGGPQKVFDLAKQFVEEGAVPRPSNIKGDAKRQAFIKAVETDSGVKYYG